MIEHSWDSTNFINQAIATGLSIITLKLDTPEDFAN
jgi:hypothetical protein